MGEKISNGGLKIEVEARENKTINWLHRVCGWLRFV